MNIAKNMEAIFVAIIAIAAATSIATASVPKFRTAPASVVASADVTHDASTSAPSV